MTRILIADDHDVVRSGLLKILESQAKCEVVGEASDGDEAMRQLLENHPDLVVLDVMMPGQSGWEVCRSIRETDSLKDTGVIMLTGVGERLNEMTSPLYGADAFLDKPFDFAALDQLITEVLDKRGYAKTD